MLPIINQGERIEKKWGYELIIHNSEKYCGKLLCFKANSKFSNHFHLLKTETWYVAKGEFYLTLTDTEKATKKTFRMKEGDIITLEPAQPHQVAAITDVIIFEVSTQHFDSDSYRIEPGDSQV